MNIYLLLAHPNNDSLNGAIADRYQEAAILAGHTVRRQNIGDIKFDPILQHGYKTVKVLEPDLQEAQVNLEWCQHWVIVYPMWWGSVPALFKGFLDRTLLPGFAFKYHTNDPMWDKLLKGRSAQLISTSDGPWWWNWLAYRNCDFTMLKKAVLNFCGFSPVKTARFDNIRNRKPSEIKNILHSIKELVPKS